MNLGLEKTREACGVSAKGYNNYMHTLEKKFLIQVVGLLIITFTSLAIWTGKLPDLPFLPKPPKATEVIIKDVKINVLVADTPALRKQGLGGRESLGSNEGMLFVFPKADKTVFWMKGLKFPLDIIWIRGKKVVDIIKNVPPPLEGQTDDQLPRYMPKENVDMVLEVNGGFADANNIQIGDTVIIQQ